jgi:hypothetical protein
MVKPVRIKPVARVFLRVLRAAHLPHFRLYDLRHTYASHLIAAGSQIDYVEKQLGHSKLTTTLLYYAHWFPKGDRRHVEAMARTRALAAPPLPAVAPDDVDLALDEALNDGSWHHSGTTRPFRAGSDLEGRGMVGEPWWTRTTDPLIKRRVAKRTHRNSKEPNAANPEASAS